MGLYPEIIFFYGIFHFKPSIFGGPPLLGNLHFCVFRIWASQKIDGKTTLRNILKLGSCWANLFFADHQLKNLQLMTHVPGG